MSYAEVADGAYGRVATNHFTVAGSGGVALVGSYHIGGEQFSQAGQVADKFDGDVLGFVMGTLALLSKAEAGFHLVDKLVVEAFNIDPRVVGQGVAADTGVSEVAGEEDGSAQVYNLGQHAERGEGMFIGVMEEERVGGLRSSEFAYDLGEEEIVHLFGSLITDN